MKIKLTARVNVKEKAGEPCRIGEPGEIVDLPYGHAVELVAMGRAEAVPEETKSKAAPKAPEPKAPELKSPEPSTGEPASSEPPPSGKKFRRKRRQ